jgi:hypothetical protein
MKNGGITIFTHQSYKYEPINLEEFYIEQTIEVCAMKLYHPFENICILTVYRTPSRNFIHFLNTLEAILNRIYTKSKNIILCGDINYLDNMGNNKIG